MATNTNYSDKCPMCRNPLIDAETTSRIKTNENNYLVSELFRISKEAFYLQRQNDRLYTYFIVCLILTICYTCLFYMYNPHVLINFFKFIWSCIFLLFNSLDFLFNIFISSINWVWSKIGMYVMSFIVLGGFTLLSNGHLPFIPN